MLFSCVKTKPGVREYMTEMLQHWAEYGVDGFRFDSAERLFPYPHWDWWRIVRRELKAENPQLLMFGEVFETHQTMWTDDRLDLVYDIPFHDALAAAAAGRGPANRIAQVLQKSAALDPTGTRYLRYMSNHDADRALTRVGGDQQRLRLAYAALFTLPGVPSFWYGDETGMAGGGIYGPNRNREFMNWHDSNRELTEWVRLLARLRAADSTLRNVGTCTILPSPAPGRILIVERLSRDVPRSRDYRMLFNFSPHQGVEANMSSAGRFDGNWDLVIASDGASATAEIGKRMGTQWLLPPKGFLLLTREASSSARR